MPSAIQFLMLLLYVLWLSFFERDNRPQAMPARIRKLFDVFWVTIYVAVVTSFAVSFFFFPEPISAQGRIAFRGIAVTTEDITLRTTSDSFTIALAGDNLRALSAAYDLQIITFDYRDGTKGVLITSDTTRLFPVSIEE